MNKSEPKQNDGWIATDGSFYVCGFGGHDYCAEQLGSTVYRLEEQGWCHISSGVVVNYRFRPTQAQLDTLFDIMMLDPKSSRGLSLSVWFDGGQA